MSHISNGLKIPTSPLLEGHKNGAINIKLYTSPSDSHSHSKKSSIDSAKSTHSLPRGTSSIFGVYQNFLNALVGAGILGIPSVYAMCGILGGIALMIIFAILSTYTMNLLIKTAQIYRVTEYEELGYVTFGTFGYLASAAALFLLDFGSCLNYLIILGDASFKVLQIWGYNSLPDRQLIIIIVSMIVIFPPCLWRDISFYEKLSGIKIIGIVVVVCVVFYQWIMYRVVMGYKDEGYVHKYTPPETETVWFDITGIPSAVGIVAYCFVAHDTAFLYYNTLFNPTTLRWSQTVLLSIGSAMILSLILSIPAYLTFGSKVEGNVMNNYEVKIPSMIITRIVYVIMMALTLPTAFFVVRHVIYAGFCRLLSIFKIMMYRKNWKKRIMNGRINRRRRGDDNIDNIRNSNDFEQDIANYSYHLFQSEYNVKTAPLWHHVMFTCILFVIPLVLSLYVLDLGAAMSIIGSLSSVNLAFVLPCITHIKGSKYGFKSFITQHTIKEKWNAWIEIYPPFILAILGIFIAIYGVISTVNSN